MSASTRVGTAVAAGYVLGRFRKMRLALIVGSALANRNVRAAGMDLLRGKSEAGGRISSPILDMGRSALVGAASTSMNRISDRLHERSVALGGVVEEDEERSDEEPLDEDEEEFEDEDEEPEDEYEDEEEDEGETHRSSRRARAAAPGRA
jgi:hypothetical protein